MLFVSIGIDCDVANFLNKYNLRKVSLPFDWNVSYSGVSKCIENDFKNFTEPLSKERINTYDIYFHHDFLEDSKEHEEKEKFHRRCVRLMNLFDTAQNTGEYILFIRKGHLHYHHEEQNEKYKDITDDTEDAKRLDKVLRSKYPLLKYKIIVLLGCTTCFTKDTVCPDDDTPPTIDVYNNVSGKFEERLLNIVITEIREHS